MLEKKDLDVSDELAWEDDKGGRIRKHRRGRFLSKPAARGIAPVDTLRLKI